MSKYSDLYKMLDNHSADYNDKIKSGRSLKFFGPFYFDDVEKKLEEIRNKIPYVTKTFNHTFPVGDKFYFGFIRIYVKEVK